VKLYFLHTLSDYVIIKLSSIRLVYSVAAGPQHKKH